jgi:predicted amidohydrolase
MKVLEKIAGRYDLPVIYCNQVGGNDDLVFDGSSMVVDKKGRLILRGNEFCTDTLIWESDADYR